MEPQWINWARRLQAVAQNGLHYTENHFDVERYQEIQRISAEMLAVGSGHALNRVVDVLAQQNGHATPKVDVRGVVFQGEELLLVQEQSDGCWTLPGGWADPGESPRQAVVREIWEESGFQTRAVKLVALYDRSLHPHDPPFAFHVYKLLIQCELLGGEPKTSNETAAVGFFRQENLPPLSVTRVTPGQIQRMFAHREHPDWPADFD